MHEMSLCESVIRIVEEHAGTSRVTKVILEVGELSGVEVEAMRFCFAAVAHDTVAAGAELEIQRPQGRAWCMHCAREVALSRRFDPCPQCGGFQLQVVGGAEMRIKELEVE